MRISFRGNAILSRLKALLTIQRINHTLAETGVQAQYYADVVSGSVLEQGKIDTSKWRKLDSRSLGITRSMISSSSWIVVKVLQSEGFQAYLVGGCVRDLLLNKVPKDFDVITTAALKEIKKKFNRCEIVGRRFPICQVHVKGSIVEVSSFETVAEHTKEKKEFLLSQMPHGCDVKDFIIWRNCMHRDFTINSLFFDPFVNEIYDYANGMMDLKSLKLRTLIPAQLSFEEDCARILRGLRIAARLGLSFSKETEIAIRKLSSSVTSLAKAAYLAQQAREPYCQSSAMLMKLFFNLDKLFTCDQPADCRLWVGLLAFHLALVNNPQDALVVWTFASVLYHARWKEGVKFAREHAQGSVIFIPEILEACNIMSEDELAERVTQLARVVQDSVDALTETDCLHQAMSRFPDSPSPGLVFVSRKMRSDTANLFSSLVNDVRYCQKGRVKFHINYELLRRGNLRETRLVFGKIIMDTLSSGIVQESKVVMEEKDHLHVFDCEHKVEVLGENCDLAPSNIEMQHVVGKEDKKHNVSQSNTELLLQERAKKQKLIGKKCSLSENGRVKQRAFVNEESKKIAKHWQEMIEKNEFPDAAKKHQKAVEKERSCISQNEIIQKQQNHLPLDERVVFRANALEKPERVEKHLNVVEKRKHFESSHENEKHGFHQQKGNTEKNKKQIQDVTKEKQSRLVLSSLFR
ncbi:Poly(A) polymerase I [Camellia lanceoleosa]|uniref:Poly(A) polymerase I n=1 Tax=Camellia lanceoleosa TaxID=1840588 RepID=A0ACC0J164_9ERIC|nr:Poly(A) polymerase I [Camellia lanceoleosa]